MLAGNPAISGAEGDGTLRLSYLSFYPGKGYNLHSFFVSYDSYISGIHGGAGAWLSNDIQGGIINDIRGGLSYSYLLRAGEELYISAGLSAGIFHRTFSTGTAILPDMIDPFGGVVLPPGETLQNRNNTVFDLGAGFLFMYHNYTGGIAMSHLSQPDISETNDQLKRKLIIHASQNFTIRDNNSLAIIPVIYCEIQEGNFMASLGSSAGTDKLSVNAILLTNSNNNLNLQTGLSAGTGRIVFFYNYRLNLVRGSNLLPISLQHQTGLAFSLNHVDKRNLQKTISLPKM